MAATTSAQNKVEARNAAITSGGVRCVPMPLPRDALDRSGPSVPQDAAPQAQAVTLLQLRLVGHRAHFTAARAHHPVSVGVSGLADAPDFTTGGLFCSTVTLKNTSHPECRDGSCLAACWG